MRVRGALLVMLGVGATAGLAVAACVPEPPSEPVPSTLAVAYSEVDGTDGYDADGQGEPSDVLVAELLDADHDRAVSAGDTISMGRYPLGPDVGVFGTFENVTHEVAAVIELVGSWTGCDEVPSPERCVVTMDGPRTVTHTFALP